MHELYKRHRPRRLDDLAGQPGVVNILRPYVEGNKQLPHALLFTGPSGCGKTTLARICRRALKCYTEDFIEMNMSDHTGIDAIRTIERTMRLKPMRGKVRMWLLDECHMMSKNAQAGLLKILEDTPKHVHFVLATTDPQRLDKTILTRCTTFQVKALDSSASEELVQRVCEAEDIDLDEEVRERLIDLGGGSARQLLVLLDVVRSLESADDQLEALQSVDAKEEGIELARALMEGWKSTQGVLKRLKEEPEKVRRIILGYFTSILLSTTGDKAAKAAWVIRCFERNVYDSGKAGLSLSCYDYFHD